MASHLTIHQSLDVTYRDIATDLVDNCAEAEFLTELAKELDASHRMSGHDGEKAFLTEAAAKVRDLAKWLTENSP